MGENDESDPTDAASIGTTRELLRTVGDITNQMGITEKDGDDMAAEVDRAVESVTAPGATAEDVDRSLFGLVDTHRRQQAEAEPNEPAIATREHDRGEKVTVDLPPSQVKPFRQGETLLIKTPPAECEMEFHTTILAVEWLSDPHDDISEFVVVLPDGELEGEVDESAESAGYGQGNNQKGGTQE